MGEGIDGSKRHFKDCFQQSKNELSGTPALHRMSVIVVTALQRFLLLGLQIYVEKLAKM